MADTTGFTGPYNTMYQAAMSRLNQNTAAKRAQAVRGAAVAGVNTSGVSQIPQNAISQEAVRSAADIGSNVAQQQESERLQDKAFQEKKDLLNLQGSLEQAAMAKAYGLQNKGLTAGLIGQIGGAGLGGIAGALAKKYL